MTIEEFFHLCSAHDWTYEFSDDQRAWRAGRAEREVLQAAVAATPAFLPILQAWVTYINARSDARKPQLSDFIINPLELPREDCV